MDWANFHVDWNRQRRFFRDMRRSYARKHGVKHSQQDAAALIGMYPSEWSDFEQSSGRRAPGAVEKFCKAVWAHGFTVEEAFGVGPDGPLVNALVTHEARAIGPATDKLPRKARVAALALVQFFAETVEAYERASGDAITEILALVEETGNIELIARARAIASDWDHLDEGDSDSFALVSEELG